MLGTFLELSVWSRDITTSLAFWEPFGFQHGQVGDTWSHRYAVLSDGRFVLGLHEYEFDSPSLTWVRPGLAESLPAFRDQGIQFEFAKTGTEEFHEAGFRDPAGHVVTLLEARTWSPSFDRRPGRTMLGHFREYRYPAAEPAAVVSFWERLGLLPDDAHGPRAVAGGICLAPRAGSRGPELVFEHIDLPAAVTSLVDLGHAPDCSGDGDLLLGAPDGLTIRVIEAS